MVRVIFSHGKESGPWGSKIITLATIARSMGYEVDSLDYRATEDPDKRVEMLVSHLNAISEPRVLVGSSMGGYVSATVASRSPVSGVFLLAPAFYMPGYQQQDFELPAIPIEIVHGWRDDVVPVDNAIRFARNIQCTLHLIDGDHRLNSSIEEVGSLFTNYLERYWALHTD